MSGIVTSVSCPGQSRVSLAIDGFAMEEKEEIRFTWDEDDVSRDSQEGGSILQTSMDDRDDSSNSVQVGDQSPGRSRERLVLKLKRITDRYYMVEHCGDSSYLNYSYLR